MRRRLRNQNGTALLETAITLPIILLVSVGIFEFGRAYQVQQVLTNAAREGARLSILEGISDDQVNKRVMKYLDDGKVVKCGADGCDPAVSLTIERTVPFEGTTASKITISYPYQFMVLGGVVRLVRSGSTVGAPLTMTATAFMRNE
jgi:Flp pilus assembly protein TadG